jgi:hypothetical protein
MDKILGFTGTRKGMTTAQKEAFSKLLMYLRPNIFQHGDCIGADAEAHDIVRAYLPDVKIEARPGPTSAGLRANKKADVTHPVKSFLERNRDIVHNASAMVATPQKKEEQ